MPSTHPQKKNGPDNRNAVVTTSLFHSGNNCRTSPTAEPVFCDSCPDLALALLNGTPLCFACLMKAIEKVVSPAGENEVDIEPLPIRSDG